jgi:hypothetical protein
MAFNYSGYAASHPKFGGFFSNRIDRTRPFVSGWVFRPRKAGKDCCFMNVLRCESFVSIRQRAAVRPNEELKPLGNG